MEYDYAVPGRHSTIIDSPSALADLCSALRDEPVVYIDTEFVGESRYYAEVGAIQIAGGSQVALIDPLAVTDLSPLFPLLTARETEKVFHAGRQDWAILFQLMGRPVAPLFDAQIAAAMLGYDDQISLHTLVLRVTGRRLRKSHAFTDWLRRPLTPAQVEYALEDVRCLAPVYDHLVEELTNRGRMEWAREEFASWEKAARYTPPDPRTLFRQMRGVERMHGDELRRLREIVAWREETARELNIPPRRVCMEPVLIELAHRPVDTVEELTEVRGLRPDQARRFGPGMIEALKRDGEDPPPRLPRGKSLPAAMEPTVDFLGLCLRSLAAENEISPILLANRADLTAIVIHGEAAKVPLMRGWRREAVGNALLATLQGNATARILPDSLRVHLDWNGHNPDTR
jgi:ribonuclease D